MEDLEYQVALTFLKGVGPVMARTLLSYCGSARALFSERKEALLQIPGISMAQVESVLDKTVFDLAKREIEFMANNGVEPLFFTSSNYPRKLSYCDDAPLLLYKRGNGNLNSGKFLSVVGTRNITPDGRLICEQLLGGLARRHPDLVIVSGLAYGVDVVAHKVALSHGVQTIACLGHGLDKVYPYLHTSVSRDIEKSGALLTEFPSKTQPDKFNFVRRNRIIAGLSQGLLVVESGEKGGSLISARLAADYNREVMAIPGRLTDPMSAGCNKLIQENVAALVMDVADIEFQMGWESAAVATKQLTIDLFPQLKSDEERMVFKLLENHKELDVNQLVLLSELPVFKITPILLAFEFEGIIKMMPGNGIRFVG